MFNEMFQIGVLPVLNTLHFQNSSWQLATDRLFIALARYGDIADDTTQGDFWSALAWHDDGNSTLSFAVETRPDSAVPGKGNE
jgi:hypothetical protein